ncbi:hypothetical protein CRG98_032020 [Punica granatum]|uniref:Uncharacterized protein n=1 Tax=Punica granatum TaxID=22663 RepID=A0A2I0IU98_PUNGR|nr:hypothetical protein CRG98_032020 [Punica granatum]
MGHTYHVGATSVRLLNVDGKDNAVIDLMQKEGCRLKKAHGMETWHIHSCAHPNFASSGHACTRLCNAVWECPPSRGRATDALEKESPFAICHFITRKSRADKLPGSRGTEYTSLLRHMTGPSGLNSVDRLQGGARPASWTKRAEVWAARVGWADRARVRPQKGALGREHERAGPSAGARPNLRVKRVARSGLNPRRGETSRIISAGLGRAGWAKSAGLDLHKPKRWAELVRRKTSEKTRMGGEEGSDGREWRFPPLGVATTAREGTGDGGEHRLGYAVLGRGVFEFSSEGFSEFNRRKSGELRGGNRGVLLRGVSRVRSRVKIRTRGRDFEGEPRPPSRVSREREGEREGEIAAEGTCRGSERWRVGRTCQWWQAVAVGRQPRRVEDGRGTSVKEEEKKWGEKRREGKNGRGKKEEEEKKRGRSGKKEKVGAQMKRSKTFDPRQTGLLHI